VITLPRELLERHGGPSPRYTSYPTAMHWGAPPAAEAWCTNLTRTLAAAGARLGIYVHTPFCQSLCTFCGCNMRVARSHALAAPYVSSVLQELELYRVCLGHRPVTLGSLYLGGGTPTWLPLDQIDRLLTALLADVELAADGDFAVEADPRNTTREHLALLRRHGFNRLIIGVQDFDARVLEIVNRVQTEEEVQRVLDESRALGFESVAFDMIYGLPLQTADSLRTSLGILLRMAPERVNFLPYAHVPWIKPSQRLYTEADLPDPALRQELFLLGRALLTDAGYVEIGIDQYALRSDPLVQALDEGRLTRNFMGFSASRIDALIGLGVSAIGDAGTMYAQNEKNLQQYQSRVAAGELPLQRGHVLNEEDRAIRAALWTLLAGAPLRVDDTLRQSAWWPEVRNALEPMARDGLLELSDRAMAVTPLGRAFLPRIGLSFDRYLHQAIAA